MKLPFPSPTGHLTAWRTARGMVGVFFVLRDEGAAEVFGALEQDADALRQETELSLDFRPVDNGRPSVAARAEISCDDEDAQLA